MTSGLEINTETAESANEYLLEETVAMEMIAC